MREGFAWREPCVGLVLWQKEDGSFFKFGVSNPREKGPVLQQLDAWMDFLHMQGCIVVILGDGAGWIWDWAKKYPWAVAILDYYHLKENVWDAAKAIFGDKNDQTRPWAECIINFLWLGRINSTIDILERKKASYPKEEEKQEAITSLITYIHNHKGLIKYSHHKVQQRCIGSGAIESFCKQLFTMRMKGPGMFWSDEGAKSIMSLRTVYLTGHWNKLWNRIGYANTA